MDKSATIGVWASALRQASRVLVSGQQAAKLSKQNTDFSTISQPNGERLDSWAL
jgi:hypothetical protein